MLLITESSSQFTKLNDFFHPWYNHAHLQTLKSSVSSSSPLPTAAQPWELVLPAPSFHVNTIIQYAALPG